MSTYYSICTLCGETKYTSSPHHPNHQCDLTLKPTNTAQVIVDPNPSEELKGLADLMGDRIIPQPFDIGGMIEAFTALQANKFQGGINTNRIAIDFNDNDTINMMSFNSEIWITTKQQEALFNKINGTTAKVKNIKKLIKNKQRRKK